MLVKLAVLVVPVVVVVDAVDRHTQPAEAQARPILATDQKPGTD